MHLLLSELEQLQTTKKYLITRQDKSIISSGKKARRLQKFKDFMALGLVVKYIDTDSLLAKLLVLSKESRSAIYHTVYKQALVASEPERLVVKRIKIWTILLKLKQTSSDYNAFKQKVI